MSNYEIFLSRDDGTRLALLDTVGSFDYSIVLHGIGVCTLTLPDTFDRTLLAADRRIEVWRQPEDGALALERVYLVRRLTDTSDRNGVRNVKVVALDGNHLLKRRTVAYNEGSAQATMTECADDMCKYIVYYNLMVGALAARRISSTYLTGQALAAVGPILTMAFSRRNVLTVLQDIAKAADAVGTPVYWHVADATPTQWEFRTSLGQPGMNHSYPSGQNPVLLSAELGNLAEPSLDEDFSDEVNYAYAGGKGEAEDRLIQMAEDTVRSGRSLFGRCEGFINASNSQETTADILAAANQLLADGEPKLALSASIVDGPGTRYGLHWRWGDRVTMVYAGRTMDAIVRAVQVSVAAGGKETITAHLEGAG